MNLNIGNGIKKICILGLQGAYLKHKKILDLLKVNSEIIKYSDQIDSCDGLIIPGGESTTMLKLMDESDMWGKLKQFPGPMFGTCAGAILLSNGSEDNRNKTLGRVPVRIERNAYGRQVESFTQQIVLSFDKKFYPAVFIRAPKISHYGKEIVVLGRLNNQAVFIRYKNNLMTTFHPELTEDTRIHEYFLNKMF